ncbi:putative aminotransferase [Neonectria ditissima]|uniref:Putative aminotransferase n=1 Tax=Neonectria ditissima TaxID=78410 RepID=A0A0P7BHR3_9HYPO|nr:putative aminotransferase [Neonectria ditissima]
MAPSLMYENELAAEVTAPSTAPDAISPAKSKQVSTTSAEPWLLHRSLIERPCKVDRAAGSYLFLTDGRQILDACGGAAVAVIGHGNEEVVGAVASQMARVSYVHTLAYTTESAEELARCILQRDGSEASFDHGLVKAFFVGSGSEANDIAMKCARQYWFEKGQPQRRHFVSRRQGYHGNTIATMSVSTVPGRKAPYHDILLPHVSHVSPADMYHGMWDGETESEFVTRLLGEIEDEFLKVGPENIVSFIAETVVGAALGSMPAPTGYWPGVRALCDKYGILLHLDEVMCGSGRTGTYFAFEQEGIQPDIVTIGKGLGGGYAPIASMLINQKIVDGLKQGTSAFNHGQTYQAHPVSCAAALAVQKVMKRDGLVATCARKGERLGQLLATAFQDCEYVGDIRGRGLFRSVEFMEDTEKKIPFPKSVGFGVRVQGAAFNMGVAVYPGAGTVDGVQGDHVLFAPPYTASDEEMETAVWTVRRAYDEVVKFVKTEGLLMASQKSRL